MFDFSPNKVDRYRLSPPELALLTAEVKERLKKIEEDYNHELGTTDIVWPQELTTETYFFDEKKFDEEGWKKQGVTAGYQQRARTHHPELWSHLGAYYDRTKYASVPIQLTLHSSVRPEHKINWNKGCKGEYRFPLRYIMEGDEPKVISGEQKPEEFRPCVFCLGHPYSDNCKRYLTPANRLRRFRNINFTLFLWKVAQLCPGCLSREIGHPHWDECQTRRSCGNCVLPAHHTALCTSATHAINILTPREKGKQLEKASVTDYMFLDKQIVADEQNLIYLKRNEIINRVKKDFTWRLLSKQITRPIVKQEDDPMEKEIDIANELSLMNPVPCNQSSLRFMNSIGQPEVFRDCSREPFHDVHFNHRMFADLKNVADSLQAVNFGDRLDKHRFTQMVQKCLTQVTKEFQCSNAKCKSNGAAAFFCKCGMLGLCPRCAFGNKDLVYKSGRKRKFPKCDSCLYRMVPPQVPGFESCHGYLEMYKVALSAMKLITEGMSKWASSNSPSPSMDEYVKFVHTPVELLRKQFMCQICERFMDNESRICMQAFCKCGYIMCRHCFIEKSILWSISLTQNNTVPACYQVLHGYGLRCIVCKANTAGFGTCKAMTTLAAICRVLLDDVADMNQSSLLETFVAAMRHKGIACNDDGGEQVFPRPSAFAEWLARPLSPATEPVMEPVRGSNWMMVRKAPPERRENWEISSEISNFSYHSSDNESSEDEMEIPFSHPSVTGSPSVPEVEEKDVVVSHPSLTNFDQLQGGFPRDPKEDVESGTEGSDDDDNIGSDIEDEDESDVNDDEDIQISYRNGVKKEQASNFNEKNGVVAENVVAAESLDSHMETALNRSAQSFAQWAEQNDAEQSIVAAPPTVVALPSNQITHPSNISNNDLATETRAGVFPAGNLTDWQKTLLRIRQVLIQRKDNPEAMPILAIVEEQALTYTNDDLKAALFDIHGFLGEGGLTPPIPQTSMSQLSATTPSYADQQLQNICSSHPTHQSTPQLSMSEISASSPSNAEKPPVDLSHPRYARFSRPVPRSSPKPAQNEKTYDDGKSW